MHSLLAWPLLQNQSCEMALLQVQTNTVNGVVQTEIHFFIIMECTVSLDLDVIHTMIGMAILVVEEATPITAVTMNTVHMGVARTQTVVIETVAMLAVILQKLEVQQVANHDLHVQIPLLEVPDLHLEVVVLQVAVSNRIINKDNYYEY